MRMYRFDTDDDLQAAIDAGDVMTFTTNGKTMHAVVNVELNTSAKKNNAETMASDVLELSAETSSIFDSIWSKLSPDVNDADSGASSSNQGMSLVLQGASIFFACMRDCLSLIVCVSAPVFKGNNVGLESLCAACAHMFSCI